MKKILILIFLLRVSLGAFSQHETPYKTSLKIDGPVIAAGLGLNVLGLSLIRNKEELTDVGVMRLAKTDVNRFDRFAAGNYSSKADDHSYYPFYGAFIMPAAFLLNRRIGKKAGQVMVLYLETMTVTGMVYSLTAGTVNRSRPLVYGDRAGMDKRKSKNSQRSFFAGHTAATAAATFFAAKIFSDFNTESAAKPYIWAAAAIIPASVGYLRLKAGQHFLSDNIIGYAIGAGAGILIPELHKSKAAGKISYQPLIIKDFHGLSLNYTF